MIASVSLLILTVVITLMGVGLFVDYIGDKLAGVR